MTDDESTPAIRRRVPEGEHGAITVNALIKDATGRYRAPKGKPRKDEEIRYRALTRLREGGKLRQVARYGTTEEEARTVLGQFLDQHRQKETLNSSSTVADVLRHLPTTDLQEGPQDALRAVLAALEAQHGGLSMVDLSKALRAASGVDLTADQAMELPGALAAVLSAMVED